MKTSLWNEHYVSYHNCSIYLKLQPQNNFTKWLFTYLKFYFVVIKFSNLIFYSSNSLFAIPANQEFVFVQTKVNLLSDRNAHMVNSLVGFCKDPNSDCSRNNDDIINTFSTLHLEPNGKLWWECNTECEDFCILRHNNK
jgi:hypothetical protein